MADEKVNFVLDPETNEKVSKSELKRRLKQREKEKKQAEKQLAQPTKEKEETVAEDPRLYFENRCKQVLKMREEKTAYPHKFNVSISIQNYIEKYKNLEDGARLEECVSVAGRVHNIRQQSKGLIFYDLHGEGEKIQIMASSQDCEGDFIAMHSVLQRGDIVGVVGRPGKSKRGELSIFPSKVQLLTPCLRTLPKANYGFKDVEQRYRMRYLDLIMNHNVRNKFVTRAKIINYLRTFLDTRGFLEVETPMMNMIAGNFILKRWCYCETFHYPS
jgi:lysyl-tRNA synthetase class 2